MEATLDKLKWPDGFDWRSISLDEPGAPDSRAPDWRGMPLSDLETLATMGTLAQETRRAINWLRNCPFNSPATEAQRKLVRVAAIQLALDLSLTSNTEGLEDYIAITLIPEAMAMILAAKQLSFKDFADLFAGGATTLAEVNEALLVTGAIDYDWSGNGLPGEDAADDEDDGTPPGLRDTNSEEEFEPAPVAADLDLGADLAAA